MWHPAPRTEAAATALAMAEADRRERPERYDLDVDRVVEAAVRTPDDEGRFADGWRQGLERYLGSAAEDGRLNAIGIGMVTSSAVGRLRAGAAMSRFIESRGGADIGPARPPIVITGGWRTGTTFLFRLLILSQPFSALIRGTT